MPLQYLLARMRTCRSPLDGSHADSASVGGGCFASVGSAAHSYHGDDAVGYGPGYMVVADGVSGTMKASGVLARLLVAETLVAFARLRKRTRESGSLKPGDFAATVLAAAKNARRATKRKGRLDSTLTAVFFDESARQMLVFTIGDCKCVLVRDGKVVFESDSIIYDFNVPAVVSSNKAINYTGDVHVQTCAFEPGDVCLAFSDGVHDNLFVDQVVACVEPSPADAEEIAKKTVQMAKSTFADNDAYIPFAVSAAGFCREAMEELKTSEGVNADEYEAFRQKCENIPAFEIARPMFAKENRVRQLAFYSASNLLAFAHKRQGKRDDVSVCAAVLA
ncbi:hypothetical protein PybrP1_003328 [[Pythium] brassicae (nom. inval.)]|nr:hypothetical protein PybrP1_003328 [[Pythium] brassicae (nom. inval.)]